MRAGMIMLVAAMAVGTVMSAACDRQEQRTVVVPEASKASSNSNVASLNKGATPPVQGQVDTKEPAQRRDFEQKK